MDTLMASDIFQFMQALQAQSPVVQMLAGLCVLAALAITANIVVRKILLRAIHRLLRHAPGDYLPEIERQKVLSRLANIVPAIVVMAGIGAVAHMPPAVVEVVRNVVSACIILSFALALSGVLNTVNAVYARRPQAAGRPIKGYVQMVKLALVLVAAILIVAALIDRSPVILLSGLGAMAAVLMLVFQDTLLSLVASVQITSGDMVRVGDWIEMPQLNADGDVIDIALHTVKVQNWDKTITTIPTRRLISDPFKNWRGMSESGGRRIKRAVFVDQNSIRFLSARDVEDMQRFRLLRPYLARKSQELDAWNNSIDESDRLPVNARSLTNIGTFRAYVEAYLRQHAHIHQDMTLLVRQLAPGAAGLPVEIYCFTNTTAWGAYEGVQADIFDHLYAIMHAFGLRAYQSPAGSDLQALSSLRAAPHAA